jgi:hypothetical protein
LETKGHYFCLVQQGENWETREIQVGSSNDSFMTLQEGLQEGEVVVLNPRAHPDKLQLPDLPDPPSGTPSGEPAPAGPSPDQSGQRGPDPKRPPRDGDTTRDAARRGDRAS